MTNTTELFQAMNTAEAAWNANELNIELLHAYEATERAYFGKIAELRKIWDTLPDGERKDSAITNAYDTEGTEADELRWFEIALMTYELNG